MFPWTGLAAIIFVPVIYIIGILIILLGMRISKNKKFAYFFFIWITIIALNTLLAINMYPQEFRPSVTNQIKFTFQVVTNFDSITEDDLKLCMLDDFNRYDCQIKNSRERYVAALYKYQLNIPRDGNNFLYGRTDNPIMKMTDIKSNLATGQDKLIWWLLEKR
ncbi:MULTISPECIES: hypothetical protein [Flavobacterium]|uniref:hypothetical protein n=1 Tax=Flavobacterium TaxID=237 RepID=UPI001FCBFD05|nr:MULTISPECIES: hypothetical protein [Flavobacterium]UOK42215.1 hypothetical protein LZF87_12960 [Flavobacterium enshiense]